LIEELDFNRCNGRLSFSRNIAPQVTDDSRVQYLACLSPTGNILYISNTNFSGQRSTVEQYDLSHPDPLSTKYLVFDKNAHMAQANGIQLAPNRKIYFIAGKTNSISDPVDRAYLQVIHNPDISGPGCNYEVNGLYLQGHIFKSAPLPYFSNYYLGVLRDSECDSLGLSVAEVLSPQAFTLSPNPAGHRVNLHKTPDMPEVEVRVYDAQGRFLEQLIFPKYLNTLEINTSAYPQGIYQIRIQSESGHSTYLKFIRGD